MASASDAERQVRYELKVVRSELLAVEECVDSGSGLHKISSTVYRLVTAAAYLFRAAIILGQSRDDDVTDVL